jgi:hypothetical protein
MLVLVLISCTKREQIPLEALPTDYSFEDAVRDGVVLHTDGEAVSGKEAFYAFSDSALKGKTASVRLGFYYTLDESRVTAEYYEENKDRYPVLYLSDLTFDGESYVVRRFENGKELVREYKHMKYLPFYPKNVDANYERIEHYVLLNDDTVSSYDEIWRSLASSRLGDYIEHMTVYSEYVRK